jgi:hypothetical protein
MLLSECPSFASLMTNASTSSGWYLHQLGGRLLTGLIEWDFPFSCFGILYHLSIKTHSTRIFKNIDSFHEFISSLVSCFWGMTPELACFAELIPHPLFIG